MMTSVYGTGGIFDKELVTQTTKPSFEVAADTLQM